MEATFALDELLEKVLRGDLPPEALISSKRVSQRWCALAAPILDAQLRFARAALWNLSTPFVDKFKTLPKLSMFCGQQIVKSMSRQDGSLSHGTKRLIASYEIGKPCHIRGVRIDREPQVVSCLAYFAKMGLPSHLLIVPKERVASWQAAFEKLAPQLELIVSDETSTPQQRKQLVRAKNLGVHLTTYPFALKDRSALNHRHISTVWYDEGADPLSSRMIKGSNAEKLYRMGNDRHAESSRFIMGRPSDEGETLGHYRSAADFYFAFDDKMGFLRRSWAETEADAVGLAVDAAFGAAPQTNRDSMKAFVEMALAWEYRDMLVRCGFLDLEDVA